ncbi:hypothetical protein ABIE35_000778 [Paenarthrobacter sp. 4246]
MAVWTKQYNKAGSILGGSIAERIYAKLNGYGSLVVEVRFTSSSFRGSIETAVVNAGWVIEDATTWESDFRITLVRTGPRVVGLATRERFIHELRTVLSSIPNAPAVLEPTFVKPDYGQLPRWVVDRGSGDSSPHSVGKGPLYIYGEHGPVLQQVRQSFPDGDLKPSNAASRLDREHSVSSPDWRITATFLGFALLGFFTAGTIRSAFQGFPVVTSPSLVIHEDSWFAVEPYLLIIAWTLLCCVFYGVSLWGAALLGAFRGSEVTLRLPVPQKPREAVGWSWPSKDSEADEGTKTYVRIQALYALLIGIGVSFLVGRTLWVSGSIAIGLPGGLAGTVGIAAGMALAWFASRLLAAHMLLGGKSLPRLVFNIGSAAIAIALIMRLPAWAYLEGIGVGPLTSTVDWTQLVSFMPRLFGLVLVAALSLLIVWVGKQNGSWMRFLINISIGASVLVCLLTIVQTEMTAGYNLRTYGTQAFARANYPVPACLQQDSKPGTSKAVWVLGTRDNQTIVTTRSPTPEPLQESGRVSSFPTDSVVLTLVPFENLVPEGAAESCASAASEVPGGK